MSGATLLAEFALRRPAARGDQADRARRATRRSTPSRPFPVEGLHEALGRRPTRIRVVMLVAAVALMVSATASSGCQRGLHYPFNSGGRPFNSWPVFLIAPFEVGDPGRRGRRHPPFLIVRGGLPGSTTRCSRSTASSASPRTASSSRSRTRRARPTATSSTTSSSRPGALSIREVEL